MDVFESALMVLRFDEEDTADHKKKITTVYVDITTPKIDGSEPGTTIESFLVDKQETEEYLLRHESQGVHRTEWVLPGMTIPPTYPMTTMLPYFTKLGEQGWEVVSFNFSTEPKFAQALLKRKIQKE